MPWSCVGGEAGAVCTPSGSGPLHDTGVILPAGQSLSWIVTAPVRPDASGGTFEYAVSASLGTDGVVTSARDSDTLVLLLDGFDRVEADAAALAEPAAVNGKTVRTPSRPR